MGFIRRRLVRQNGHEYFYWYWCERSRNRSKRGGDGSVRSKDISIGRQLNANKLAYYSYLGDIPIQEFCSSYLSYQSTIAGGDNIFTTIEFLSSIESPIIQFRSKSKVYDLRRKENRALINTIRKNVETVWDWGHLIEQCITDAAQNLRDYDRERAALDAAIAQRDELIKSPEKTWEEYCHKTRRFMTYCWSDDALQVFEENVRVCDRNCDYYLSQYQRLLERATATAPLKRQAKFREQINSRIHTTSKFS